MASPNETRASTAVWPVAIENWTGTVNSPLQRSSKQRGTQPFRARSLISRGGQLFFDLRLPRPSRRPIAFTETLAASAIPSLDETRSQVITPTIAANQFV